MTTLTISDTGCLDAALIMFRNTPENKNLSFLFIEGDSDEKFWNGHIAESKCCIVFVVSFDKNNLRKTGKTQVIKNISSLNQSKISGFLGVIDDDFDTVFGTPKEDNICATETHDLETLLLRSPTVFKKLLAEFGDSQIIADFEKKKGKTVQDYLLDLALPFAQIECLKQYLKLSLELKDLHKNNTIIIPNKLQLNYNNLYTFVNSKGIDFTSSTSVPLIEKIEKVDPWLLCNGHTMIEILEIGFKNGVLGNNKKASSDNISSYIRAAIDKSELYQTELCQSIFNWQNNHLPYQILI